MANTYHQMYIQTVYAVKYRDAVIAKAWRQDLHAVIGNLINETGCKNIIVNGFGLRPSQSVSDVMQIAKAKSSKWLNESGLLPHRFEWQEGYGCFSYSRSHIDAVFKYIQNQEIHHQKQTFKEEYIDMLIESGIDYDEKYIFQELV